MIANVLLHMFAFAEITSVHLELAKVCRNWHSASRRYNPGSPGYKQAVLRELGNWDLVRPTSIWSVLGLTILHEVC